MLTLLIAGSLAHAAPSADITPGEVTFLELNMSQGSTFSLQVHDGSQSWYTDCTYRSNKETLPCDDLPELDVFTIATGDDTAIFTLDADSWHGWVFGARIGSEDDSSEACSVTDLDRIYALIKNNQDMVEGWLEKPPGQTDEDLTQMCMDQYSTDLDSCDGSLNCEFTAWLSFISCLGGI